LLKKIALISMCLLVDGEEVAFGGRVGSCVIA
jgi:hypothetical protein